MKQSAPVLYDYLAGFESLLNRFKKKAVTYPIHKKLYFEKNSGTKDLSDINDWILKNLPLKKDGKILDAGCGVGNTLISFCKKHPMSGLGLSLSGTEIKKAKTAAKHFKLEKKCQFLQKSFAESLPKKYDTIIAIESLKHAPDLAAALKNLCWSLKPNGLFIILEDLANEHYAPPEEINSGFLKAWSVNEFYTEKNYVDILNTSLPNANISFYDFTKYMKSKDPEAMLENHRKMQNRKKFVLFPPMKSLLETFAGGFLLDYLYAKKMVGYKMIVVENI